MTSDEDKEKILQKLESELKKDRTPSVVVGITKLGLVEMTRKKTSPSLNLLLMDECRECSGTGRRSNTESIIAALEKHIKSIKHKNIKENVTIKTNSKIAALLKNDGNNYIQKLGSYYDMNINLVHDDSIPFGMFN
jgi:ribonuclease G